LFLVNRQRPPKQYRDEAWLFQAQLSVQDHQGRSLFVRRPAPVETTAMDPDWHENRTLGMLYRDEVEFAVGHGVAVHADVDTSDPRRAIRIETRAAPAYDVPR